MTLMLSAILSLIYTAIHFYDEAVSQTTALSSMTQQKEKAEFVSQSMAMAIERYNQIAGVALNEQMANRTASQARQTLITSALKPSPCAAEPVPDAVSHSLLTHYEQFRQSAGHAYPGQPADAVSAVGTSR